MDKFENPFYLVNMTEILDATGLLCPLPVLKARKRMMPLASGARFELITDDPAALIDVPHFCAEAGHTLTDTIDQGDGTHRFILVKK